MFKSGSSPFSLQRASPALAGCLIAIAAVVPIQQVLAQTPAATLTTVHLMIDWTPLGYHAPFFYGVSQGIYKKAGLDVVIDDGKGSGSVAQLVGSGNEDLGFADATTVAQLISKGLPAKVVMGIFRGTTLSLFYAKGHGINSAADLNGKRISTCPGDAISVYMPAYLKSIGIANTSVTQVPVDCSLKYTIVAQGRADAVMSYATAGTALLKKVGITDPAIIKAGPDFYLPAHGIVASSRFIASNPAVIRRFVAATAEAYKESVTHEDAAVEALTIARPLLKGEEAILKDSLISSLAYLNGPHTAGKPFGEQSEADWQKALNILQQYGELGSPLKPSMVYTNEFIGDK